MGGSISVSRGLGQEPEGFKCWTASSTSPLVSVHVFLHSACIFCVEKQQFSFCGINKVFYVLVISFIACNNDTDFIV